MGLAGPVATRPAMPLGTVSVSPLELATAYTVFSTLGQGVEPRLVRRVERPDKEVLWEAEAAEPDAVLEPGIAFLVTDSLREALERGTGTAVRTSGFRGPAAGKTGTTNDGTDTWFAGYTPEVVAVVWVGFDQPRPIMAMATGGRVAAPVWARLMTRYYAGRTLPSRWSPPSGIFQAAVDPGTGLVLAEGCQPQSGAAYREYFLRGMSPPSVCPSRGVPVEMLAGLDLPLPDDEEATDLSLELPADLREPLASVLEDAAEEAEPAEEPAQPAPAAEEPEPAPEGAATPVPAVTPAPAPAATPTPAASPTPPPTPPPVP
jgi:penicillin-binding protein 1A